MLAKIFDSRSSQGVQGGEGWQSRQAGDLRPGLQHTDVMLALRVSLGREF